MSRRASLTASVLIGVGAAAAATLLGYGGGHLTPLILSLGLTLAPLVPSSSGTVLVPLVFAYAALLALSGIFGALLVARGRVGVGLGLILLTTFHVSVPWAFGHLAVMALWLALSRSKWRVQAGSIARWYAIGCAGWVLFALLAPTVPVSQMP